MNTKSQSAEERKSHIRAVDSSELDARVVADLFRSAGLRRPVDDLNRIGEMLRNANLMFGAYEAGKLVGLARCVTDFSFCCYLSDLAVSKEYQKSGIGRQLIEAIKLRIGPQVMLLLLSAPDAMGYYPKLGFEAVENGWIIKRKL